MNVTRLVVLVSLVPLLGCRTTKTSVRELTAEERTRMTGSSWKEGCPVPLSDLVSVEFPRGQLVVHRQIAREVSQALSEALAAGFVIERAAPIDDFGANDDASMAANNSSGFNCRPITASVAPGEAPPPPKFSVHSCGLAIDLNPLWNPYFKPKDVDAFTQWRSQEERRTLRSYCVEDPQRCVVLPPAGVEWLTSTGPGTITHQSAVVPAFTKRGWMWGGIWPSSGADRVRTDAQHFERPLPGLCSP